MLKRFARWFKMTFHGCSGVVVKEYQAKAITNYGKVHGTVSICICDVCHKKFATFETATGYRKNVSVSYAEAVAMENA